MAHQLLAENYYNNTITEDISSATWDITVKVATPPVNDKWFITISPWNLAKRETCYYSAVSWNNLTVKWINRIWGKTHTSWEVVAMMDVAEWINFLSQLNASTFYPEKVWNLQINVWGWSVLIWWTQVELNDTLLTLTDNTTNKIYFDYADDTVKTTTWSTWTNIVVYEVTTAWWAITWIIPKKPLALTWLTWPQWPQWPQWPSWSIATAPDWQAQTVNDNVVPSWTSTVTTNDTTYIKVTRADGSYTEYNLTGIREYDSHDNLLVAQLLTWVFWDQAITYADINWSVDKTTWVFTFDWELAYRNLLNVFKESNVFNKDVAFKGLCLFPYVIWANDVFEFDATKWAKQAFNISSAAPWESHTLSFKWLRSWGNYVFAVNVTWNSIAMQKATSFTDCYTITTMYSIWWTTYPLTLAVWTHIFVCEAFSTAIHVAYAWSSIAA